MKKTAVIWDLDGTLLDTLDDLADGTNHILGQYGLPERTRDEVRRFVGNGARRLIEQALPGKPGDPSVDEVLAAFQAYYSSHCQIKTKPYDGILEALDRLKDAGYPMAVVSNKPDAAVKPLCAQYFPGLFARGEDADCPRKPAPDMVFQAMKAIGAERCIYVGDSDVDIVTAKNAGAPCLSVLWGFRDRAFLEESGGVHFCEDPGELPDVIRAMEEAYGK